MSFADHALGPGVAPSTRFAASVCRSTPARSSAGWESQLRLCEARLAAVGAWDDGITTATELVATVSQRRGREVRMVPVRAVPGRSSTVCGAGISDDRIDGLFYAVTDSVVQTDHNRLHELMHLLLGHRTVSTLYLTADQAWAAVASGGAGLARTSFAYQVAAEWDADAAAVVWRVHADARATSRGRPREAWAQRLAAVLG